MISILYNSHIGFAYYTYNKFYVIYMCMHIYIHIQWYKVYIPKIMSTLIMSGLSYYRRHFFNLSLFKKLICSQNIVFKMPESLCCSFFFSLEKVIKIYNLFCTSHFIAIVCFFWLVPILSFELISFISLDSVYIIGNIW